MRAAHTQATIIAWVFASRTCAIEMYLTDTADVVVGDVPSPCCDCVPLEDFGFHFSSLREYWRSNSMSCQAKTALQLHWVLASESV